MTSKCKLTLSRTITVVISCIALIGCSRAPSVGSGPVSNAFPVLYLDLDGTALDSTKTVRDATISAISDYRSCGGHIGIATGRILEQARAAIDRIQPDLPVVLFNGAVLLQPDSQTIVIRQYLDDRVVQSAEDAIRSLDKAQGYILHYTSFSIAPEATEPLIQFAKDAAITLQSEPHSAIDHYSGEQVIKILVVCEYSDRVEVAEDLRSALGSTARVVMTSDRTVEILHPATNKSDAISAAILPLGYSLDLVAAFGDSENDVEMIRNSGLGVAMCNGDSLTISAASYVIRSHNTDALAKAIRDLLLPALCCCGD